MTRIDTDSDFSNLPWNVGPSDRQISTLLKFVSSQQAIDPEVRDQICDLIMALLPSPAVAAEPDTYRCAKRNCFYPECDCQKLATAPARGDREAIALTREGWAKVLWLSGGGSSDDWVWWLGRDTLGNYSARKQEAIRIRECWRDADAILLSLPVQPGAGERELKQRIHNLRVTLSSIVTLAESGPVNLKTQNVIAKTAKHSLDRDASRQAPHSSREAK